MEKAVMAKWWRGLRSVAESVLETDASKRGVSMKQILTADRKQIKWIIDSGGNLRSMRSSLKLVGPAEHIPSKIEVDVSQLNIEDKVLLQDVVFHPSLKLLSKNETLPVCKIAATSPVKEQEAVQA
uniref:Large ribosomal subunit protein bL25 beta domain-containing protein n=1 Tax=Brassica oleracea var. oleracea TaxID=109376 RepID=A0A0D3E2L1_BRAOL